MLRRPFLRALSLVALVALLASTQILSAQSSGGRGRKYKMPPPTSRVEITVLRDSDGKPIENAAVIFHPMEGGKDSGNMELKSNEEGKALIDVLETGVQVRLQIIAKGFQTYGEEFKLDQTSMAKEIRMKRPGGQYSIYAKHDDKPAEKPADKPADGEKK